jgi:hypothetical protein
MQVLAPSLVCVVSRLSSPIAQTVLREAAIIADFFPHPARTGGTDDLGGTG